MGVRAVDIEIYPVRRRFGVIAFRLEIRFGRDFERIHVRQAYGVVLVRPIAASVCYSDNGDSGHDGNRYDQFDEAKSSAEGVRIAGRHGKVVTDASGVS